MGASVGTSRVQSDTDGRRTTVGLVRALVLTSLAVIALDPLTRYVIIKVDRDLVGLVPFVAVANEANLPTWWNTALLVVVAAGMLCVGFLTPPTDAGRRGWFVAGGVAALLSLDELTSLHERLGPLTQAALDDLGWSVPTYAWLVPGALLGVVGLVLALAWARGLDRPVRAFILAGVVLFGAGAVGMEATAGLLKNAGHRTGYYVATLVEESLEMTGASVALGGPALVLARRRLDP